MIHRSAEALSISLSFLLLPSMLIGQPRVVLPINEGWKFIRQDIPNASQEQCNEAQWQPVILPHTWNAIDGQDGGDNYYRGIGWYRKRLIIDDRFAGRGVYLWFGAASTAARIFLNGVFVGEHRGGFAAFCFDVSKLIRFGEANLLAVQVSNARDSTIAPLSGDFTVFGGLYRGARLLLLNAVAVSPVDDASPGVSIHSDHSTPESADVIARTRIRNTSREERKVHVRCTITDHRKDQVSSGESDVTVRAGDEGDATMTLTIDSPRLWKGTRDPYLYGMTVELSTGGDLVDRVVETFGIRSFSVDPQRGFFLNGLPYPLHGVNRHQDREDKGWAIGPAEHREDFALIKEMGCNAVRLAHYQHAPECYALCDSGGIAVWAELALVDRVSDGSPFLENCASQLRELIKQNYNHPSIFCWSLFNELIPDRRERLYESIVAHLNRTAKELDPSRFTTAASRGNYDGSAGTNRITDLIGFNLYKGWYEPELNAFAPFVDTLHARYPDLKLAIAEYGAGAGVHSHEDPARLHDTRGRWHPEEWQSVVHESTWTAIAARPFLWGSFVWNMFDFASDSRSEGEKEGINDKGLVTYDRKVCKDAFYWYKANWATEPMVHITESRFTHRSGIRVSIKVYSNCDDVELFIDGNSMGRRESAGRIFSWHDLTLHEGTHQLRARGVHGSAIFRDTCTWQISSK
jgi:beta-galactosidase